MLRLFVVCFATHGALADNVRVRPWGKNALRVQVAPSFWTLTDSLPTAYLPGAPPSLDENLFDIAGPIVSGNIMAEQGADGLLTFARVSDKQVLLKETGRTLGATGSDSTVTFDFSVSATKMYGVGQNRHKNNGPGLGLNVINETYSFQASIGEEGGPSNSLPWALGANPANGGFQFGVLFNSPALGGLALNASAMTWSIMQDAGNQHVRQQFDFLVVTHEAGAAPADKPFQIMEKYVDAVGHARKLPWTGYWHSKNRYKSQDELLAVARGYHNRSIPVDVLVIDWFHWKIMGDWSFDKSKWPDPKAMVDECKSYGMEIMVSVWPFSCPGSRSYDTVVKNNWMTTLVGADGQRTQIPIETHGKNCRLVDATNPDFRKFAWSLIESGYYQYGIKIFWLDASEPEGFGPLSTNASWHAGNMRDMGSLFTLYWTQAFFDGLQSHNETDIVMLPRAGWVGTWRHGAVLWSGDIGSTMPVLKSQVNIGLSAQMSGIPWWTTDVGGYRGGNAEDPTYRETIVRWFQYGMTCPLFRQHGARDHTAIWYYGPADEKILGDIIKLRAGMKPYFSAQMDALAATGRPFNRPLMWDFPEDPMTWVLAENGIGDSSAKPTPASLRDGDLLVLGACVSGAHGWNQQFVLSDSKLTVAGAATKCVDCGGSGADHVHIWTCNPRFSSAQSWTYDVATKSLMDPKRHVCLTTGNGMQPDVGKCDPTSTAQQWTMAASGATTVRSAKGACLTAKPASQTTGVADQYMMGDDYMAAPILNLGQRSRKVYFPKGANWVHHYSGTTYHGGTTQVVDAPLDQFPLFKKVSASA